jgi:hypothetical protein
MVHKVALNFREVILGVPCVDFAHKVMLSHFSLRFSMLDLVPGATLAS